MPNCIVHIPYKLDENAMAAPMLRPRKMIEAFYRIGYNVDVVSGNSAQRKKIIKEIKSKIKSGYDYDFMYAENSTMPSVLTDSSHFPTHPFVDYCFFKFVKKHGINIGLFYRDIYWKFDMYREKLSKLKYIIGIIGYKYDVFYYKQTLRKIYFPTLGFTKYFPAEGFLGKIDELPPGAELCKNEINKDRDFSKKPLSILYIGGLGTLYNIEELLKAVQGIQQCSLTICCRKNEWEDEHRRYDKYLCENIYVVHKSGDELEELYSDADVCSLVFETDKYREITIPYKAFEYLANGKPVISTKGTAISKFVSENKIGWTVENNYVDIERCILRLINEPNLIRTCGDNCLKVVEQNTWDVRARKVINDLKT